MTGEEDEDVQSIKRLPPRLGQLGLLSVKDLVGPYSDPAQSPPQPCPNPLKPKMAGFESHWEVAQN